MRHQSGRLRLALLLALPSFVAAHDLIFLVSYGARNVGAALSRDGHGAQWMATVVSAAMTTTVLLGIGAWRLLGLAREARETASSADRRRTPLRLAPLGRELVALWPLVFIGAAALFVVVENLERLVIGQAPPGLGVLVSAGLVDAPLILATVSGVVALVVALYAWRRDVLVQRIAMARQRWARHASVPLPPIHELPRRRSLSGTRLIGRAPPAFARLLPTQA